MNKPSPEAIQKLIEDAHQVGVVALALGSHQQALTALLSAYCTIASDHPCCLQLHGVLLQKAGECLLSGRMSPPAHSVH